MLKDFRTAARFIHGIEMWLDRCILGVGWGGNYSWNLGECANAFFENLISNQNWSTDNNYKEHAIPTCNVCKLLVSSRECPPGRKSYPLMSDFLLYLGPRQVLLSGEHFLEWCSWWSESWTVDCQIWTGWQETLWRSTFSVTQEMACKRAVLWESKANRGTGLFSIKLIYILDRGRRGFWVSFPFF